MKHQILALETSGTTGSVAALVGEQLLGQRVLAGPMRTAQSLAPAVRDLLDDIGWRPRDVRLIAVAGGPGSFTGLRIGVTTAKTLAYVTGSDLLGVNTLEVIADQAPAEVPRLWALLGAQRGELFVGEFQRPAGQAMRWSQETRLVAAEAWLSQLPTDTYVSGPALSRLDQRLTAHLRRVEASRQAPMAEGVGRLAARLYAAGRRSDVWSLVPQYFRRSAAEEKWLQRHEAQKPDGCSPEEPGG